MSRANVGDACLAASLLGPEKDGCTIIVFEEMWRKMSCLARREVTGKDKCKKPCPDAVPEYPSALPSCPQHYSSADP